METYTTGDLYLAAFLKAKGWELIDNRRVGQKVNFIFADRSDRDMFIREYFNGGKVNITVFRNALQDLKTIIYNV